MLQKPHEEKSPLVFITIFLIFSLLILSNVMSVSFIMSFMLEAFPPKQGTLFISYLSGNVLFSLHWPKQSVINSSSWWFFSSNTKLTYLFSNLSVFRCKIQYYFSWYFVWIMCHLFSLSLDFSLFIVFVCVMCVLIWTTYIYGCKRTAFEYWFSLSLWHVSQGINLGHLACFTSWVILMTIFRFKWLN